MSRSFSFGSSQWFTNSSVAVTAFPVSFSIWANFSTVASTNELIDLTDNSSGFDNAFRFYHDAAGGPTISSRFSGSESGVSWNALLSTGAWHHLAGVIDTGTAIGGGNNTSLYVDGVAASHFFGSAGTPTGISTTGVGVYPAPSPPVAMTGLLSDAAVWNVALAAAEALALSQGVRPFYIRPSGLVSYWPLFGLASTEPDLSGGKRNLTPSNSPPAGSGDPPVMMFTRRWPQFLGATAATPWTPVRELKRNWLTRRGWG